jgi:putative flippase GtrA
MLKRFLQERNVSLETIWSEVWNLFKFGVVGVTSLAINTGVYALLSRVLWPEGNRTLESVISVCISGIYNFSLHRAWTFGAREFGGAMIARYLSVVVVGASLSGALFYVGHELFHLYDIAVLIGSSFMVASVTYFLHRWFTFHPGRGKKGNTGISSTDAVS